MVDSRLATPTPDDGVRRSGTTVWDESERPTGPVPEPGRPYPPGGVAAGRQLVAVHNHLRSELREIHVLVAQVVDASLDPGTARSHLNTMTMRQNSWTVGTYCATYCRVLTMHHTIEDQSLFTYLAAADERLGPVVDRLAEEHRIIHGVLESIDSALVAFVSGPDGAKVLREALDLLSDTLLSHLAYEERELIEPLARLGFGY